LLQEPLELVLLLCFFQLRDQCGSREEPHPLAEPTGGQAEGDGQVCFSRTRTAHEAAVVALLNPPAAGQLQDLGLGKSRHGTKVERIEVLLHREAGLFNARLQGIGTARGQFQLRQSQQVFQVVLIAVGRLAGELRVLGQHRRQPQGFEVRAQ
jgi:hypothetical protein